MLKIALKRTKKERRQKGNTSPLFICAVVFHLFYLFISVIYFCKARLRRSRKRNSLLVELRTGVFLAYDARRHNMLTLMREKIVSPDYRVKMITRSGGGTVKICIPCGIVRKVVIQRSKVPSGVIVMKCIALMY